MLLEFFDFGLEPRALHVFFGLALGLLFGVAAQITRFCLRRAVVIEGSDGRAAAGVWLTGLAAAILATQAASYFGFISLEGHRWLSAELPIAALLLGGLAFGVGMVLTRGCISRLTVLGASGNLRALTVLALFAITAHATMKGILSPIRTSLGGLTVEAPIASLIELPGGLALWTALAVLGLLAVALRSGARPLHLALAAVIGLVAAVGWSGTSVLLMDEFDPLPAQSVAFTLPWIETLFWTITSTAVQPTFGTGLIGGVLLGAFASALLRREVRLQSFETPAETLRYALGAALMGVGGVLAGGCTVGAGLAGGATLSVAALVALVAIVAGAWVARAVLSGTRSVHGAEAAL